MVKSKNIRHLIAVYQPKLNAFIKKRVSNREEQEDILQDVLLQWMKTLHESLNPIENLSAWLYKVTRNTILNSYKKKKAIPLSDFFSIEDEDVVEDFLHLLSSVEDCSDTPETAYLRSLVWEELEKALAELPIEQRNIFEQTELNAISVKEIAQKTGVAVNTLLSRKHYAIVHIRKRLALLYEEILSL